MADPKKEDVAVYETASPTLLAGEPSEAPSVAQDPNQDWQRLRQHLETSMAAMRQWRSSWWMGPWADVARYLQPVRSVFLTQGGGGYATPNTQTRGRDINKDILDPTATYCLRICAAGLMSGLASPSRPWFKTVPVIDGADDDQDASDWLGEVQKRMGIVLATSNFYNSFAMECTDVASFGTAPTICYEDALDIVRFYNPVCGEYFLSTDATMRIGGFARNFVLTISQIVGMFGLKNCPKDIQDLWAAKGASLHQERSIAHMIEPNYAIEDIGGDFGKIKGPFTWREVYWVFGGSSPYPLSMRGFRDVPFTAARWMTQSNDAYGHGPGMEALPDVKTLQVLSKRYAQAVEKVINPPMLADTSLRNEPATTIPGGVTYVAGLDAAKGMRPIYQINPQLEAITLQIQDVRARISKGFFNDLFLMLENIGTTNMTAYEVAQRMQEKLQVLGPVIEGLLNESLKPKLKRVFAIMERRGLLPERPPSLQNMPIDVEFVSTLAMAQKAAATGGIERLAAFVGRELAAFPNAGDILDSDEMIREYNDLLANPSNLLRGDAQVQQIRKAKADQAASAQRLAMIQQGGTAAVQAASTLSQTPIGTGSALDAVMSGMGMGKPGSNNPLQ